MSDRETPPAPPSVDGDGRGWIAQSAARLFSRLGLQRQPGPAGEDALVRRIDVPVLVTAPEPAEWAEIQAGFAILAEQGLWLSVLERLRGVDQSRQQFVSGKRYFDCALAGALSPVTKHLRPELNLPDAQAALAVFERVRADQRNDYMSAVLLAGALTEIGYALRGEAPPRRLPPAREPRERPFFARAEEVLEAFDPIQENSPMLAEARYFLIPGIDGGEKVLNDWYEDWADLDPSNPFTLMAHGRFLMPDWYGSYEAIAREARRAVARAVEGLDAGAYLYVWRAALEAAPTEVVRVDTRMMLDGVEKTLSATMSQHLANDFAGMLLRLSRPGPGEDPAAGARAAPARDRLRRGFGQVLRRHLREIHAPLWQINVPSIRAAIAEEFAAELAQGLIVRPGSTGLEAMPLAAGE